MATPNENLAKSLRLLKKLQGAGRRIFRSNELSRVHRERLLSNGFLTPIIKGWLVSTSPGTAEGDTTPWYASFWEFCAAYCDHRFGQDWALSPEQSLLLHGEHTVVPAQVVVYAPMGTNNTIDLPFDTSLFDLKHERVPVAAHRAVKDNLRLYSVPAALIAANADFYRRHPIEAQFALNTIDDSAQVLRILLSGGNSTIAGRLAGAFRRTSRPEMAEEITSTMRAAGYDVRESDPFAQEEGLPSVPASAPPVVGRLHGLWQALRGAVIASFDDAPGLPTDRGAYLTMLDDVYKRDAYHSLSIEGYSVTVELIERVRDGQWKPDKPGRDRQYRDVLAARGYWQAFQLVAEDVGRIIDGAPAGEAVRQAHRGWYRELFSPSVTAGILKPEDLAGYRQHSVFIRASRHVPPRWQSVPAAMNALFDLLEHEPEASVRAVLGHWVLGYIHPYPDGNGRMARFLMNAMLASGGYGWVLIRMEDRDRYMAALESASVDMDIGPLARLVAERVNDVSETRAPIR